MSNPKLNILVSYAYFDKGIRDILVKNKKYINLYIDSGAFTAFTKGKKITREEYQDFLIELDEYIPVYKYFALDVISEAKKTLNNYLKMYQDGFEPIPIFTRGADPKVIEEYYKTSDLVAIGGIAIKSPEVPNYVKYIMENFIKGRKVHWLGWSKKDFVYYYKPYSLDSSSWSWGQRFGDVYYVHNNTLKNWEHQIRATAKIIPKEVAKIINDVLLEGEDMHDPTLWVKDNSIPQRTCIKAYVEYSNLLKRRLGSDLYLACGSGIDIKNILDVYHKYIRKIK